MNNHNYNNMTNLANGYLEIILGPMYSGKSSRIVEIYKKCKFCNTHLHNRADQPLCIPDWQKEMIDRYGKDGHRHIARMLRKLAPPFGRYQEDIDADELNELEAWHRDWEEKSRS